MIRAVFAGEERGAKRDAILLNAAGAIAAGGHADDLRDGLELAREAVDSGAAAERLEALVAFSRWVGSATRSPGRASRRSPSSSGARRRPATSGPTPTRRRSAAAFDGAGASAVSVLVDERFAGTIDDLRAARAAAALPLLAKGFFSPRRPSSTSCARRARTPRC